MISGANGRSHDYFISSKIIQILLHWSFELVESDLVFYLYKNEILLVQ